MITVEQAKELLPDPHERQKMMEEHIDTVIRTSYENGRHRIVIVSFNDWLNSAPTRSECEKLIELYDQGGWDARWEGQVFILREKVLPCIASSQTAFTQTDQTSTP